MKKLITTLAFICLASIGYGQNQIYVNQITTAGSTTLVQVGSLNKIGVSSGTPSDITGDNILFEMRQMGDNNTTDFSITGANNLKLLSVATGNSNTQKYYLNGATNNMNIALTGNSNSVLFNKDVTVDHTSNTDDSKATLANSDVILNVTGNSNVMKFGIKDANYNYINYSITGNSNTVKSTQIGSTGGSTAKDGHEQTVTIQGSTNDLTVYQAGVEKQTFQYSLVGSGNTVRVVQTTSGAAPAMTTGGTTGPTGPAAPTTGISPPTP
jgi:hypothetical protein